MLKQWMLGWIQGRNISNHPVVTLSNAILAFSTIISLSLGNRYIKRKVRAVICLSQTNMNI